MLAALQVCGTCALWVGGRCARVTPSKQVRANTKACYAYLKTVAEKDKLPPKEGHTSHKKEATDLTTG